MVVAVVAIIAFMPADAVTEVLALVQSFLLTVVTLLGISRVAPVAAWPAPRQRLLSWSVAAAVAIVVCVEPLVLSALKR